MNGLVQVSMENEIPPFVAKRLNSIMKQVMEIEQTGKIPSFNRVEIIWNAYSELHGSILEHMEVDEFFPDYKRYSVGDSEVILELIKTKVREIADNFSLTLEIDKTNIIPSTQITQNQFVTQTNVQTLNSLIENVNTLPISQTNKEQIINLVKEFEEESREGKESKKLRGLMARVAELSIDAASLLLKHANEIGTLRDMLL